MWIREYRGSLSIDIEFEDGYTSYNRNYGDFIKGRIKNPNFQYSMLQDRTGEINYNEYGNKMTIIKYNSAKDIVVEFENGYKAKSAYKEFKNGSVSNPYDKTVYGIGYLGTGKYVSSVNKNRTKDYEYWIYMMKRCYDEEHRCKYPTYIDCEVCEEWLNFQNFAEWFHKNWYKIKDERMEIDKDILHKGNKIYSPETCVFVPSRINVLFTKADKVRGKYPIGVYFKKSSNKFASQLSMLGKNGKSQKYLGSFNTSLQAFEVYKIEKEKYIKQIADDYRSKIPQKLYNALYLYKVEITD